MTDRMRISQQDGITLTPEAFEATWAGQGQRFLATFAEFDDARWAAPTRCGEWDAHTTFRHMTDAVEVNLSGYTREAPAFARGVGDFNPQTTPDLWLAHSADESPADTLERYQTAAEAVAGHAAQGLRSGSDRVAAGPYGPVHWSVMTIHIMWDAWLHERDILLEDDSTRSIAQSSVEASLVGMYGALMTTVPFTQMDDTLVATVRLDPGTSDLDAPLFARFGHGDHVQVEQVDGTDTPDVFGALGPSVDAFGGRGQPLAEVLTGDAAIIEKMGLIGLFI